MDLTLDLPDSRGNFRFVWPSHDQGLTGRVFQLRVGYGSGIGKNISGRIGYGLGTGIGIKY